MTFINNWNSKKFVRLVLTIELAIVGLVGISKMGLNIPIIRQCLGFVFLTFIPGLIILRILRLRNLGKVETILYSVGLSLAFIMILGFLINIIYPIIGISNPISILPLIVTFVILTLILCFIVYKYEPHNEMISLQCYSCKFSSLLCPPVLFLTLVPLLSILGTYLVNFHHHNFLLLFLFPIIALIPIVIIFTNFIPSNLYPLTIISIAISLLWHWSLISIGLTGYDIHHEYYFQNMVIMNSKWDSTISSNVNSMLSVAMLVPIYSLVLNLDSLWIFKIVFPMFYSLVPLALFEVYRRQTDNQVAFMGSFFFISFPLFFSEMTQLPRQQIAELFLSLLILLLLNKEIAEYKKSLLSIVFCFSIVISHYGLSYIFMLLLSIVLPLIFLKTKSVYIFFTLRIYDLLRLSNKKIENWSQALLTNVSIESKLSLNFVFLFVILCLSWYMYIGHGSAFLSASAIFKHMLGSLYADFFNLDSRDPMIAQAFGLSPMRGGEIEWKIARFFQQITQACILLGIISLISVHYNNKFYLDFIYFSLASMVVILISIIFPYFSSSLNMGRTYHITLLFLSPFCVLGGKIIFQYFLKFFFRLRFQYQNIDTTKLVVLFILVPYFLFSSGFIFHLSGATSTSMPLTLYQNDWLFPTYPEACTSKWVEKNIAKDVNIYADEYGGMLLRYQGMIEGSMKSSLSILPLNFDIENNKDTSYIFLRRWNVLHHQARLVEVQLANPITTYINLGIPKYSTFINCKNKIYVNGNTEVLG